MFIELRRQGVPASAPLFIPFLGAVVGMKQLPDDAWKEARVALAGPILGSLGAAVCWIVGEATGSEFLVALAFVGFFLNLFNLIPIVPLDGGRAAGALHPALWFVGLAHDGRARRRSTRTRCSSSSSCSAASTSGIAGGSRGEAGDYYRLTVGHRVAVAVVYLGLIAVLGVAMSASHVERTF